MMYEARAAGSAIATVLVLACAESQTPSRSDIDTAERTGDERGPSTPSSAGTPGVDSSRGPADESRTLDGGFTADGQVRPVDTAIGDRQDARTPDGPRALGDAPIFLPAACDSAASLYCEDFETGVLGPAWRKSASGGATVAIDTSRPRGGKFSLHVKAPTAEFTGGDVALSRPFPAPGNSFFMRAFVYIASPSVPNNIYYFRLNGIVPDSTTRVYVLAGADGYRYPGAAPGSRLATFIYHSTLKSADHVSYRNVAAPQLPYDRWACWEWQVDGANNEWRLWIDNVEHISRKWNGDPARAWLVPRTASLSIGIHHPHAEPTETEGWFDDVVIAGSRIGCGKP